MAEFIQGQPSLARVRWEGSGSNPSGSTLYGYFDADASFINEAPRAASWAARMLGYPVMDVEMVDEQFYACFEQSILEYSAQINQFQMRQNMLGLVGMPTTTEVRKVITTNPLPYYVKIAEGYGNEVGVGGNLRVLKMGIPITAEKQVYDLQEYVNEQIASGSIPEWDDIEYYYGSGSISKRIEVRRVFHYAPPAISRIYDPLSQSGITSMDWLGEWGGVPAGGAMFMLRPVYEDLLRAQSIEFNDQIRRSPYSFEVVNNKVRLFPVPKYDFTLFVDYVFKAEKELVNSVGAIYSGSYLQYSGSTIITDPSNAPYSYLPYNEINQIGKQWIRKYFLALCKETLGFVRNKYKSIPIPGNEVSLNGDDLVSQGQNEREQLVSQLREDLEATSRKSLFETQAQMNEQLKETLKNVPMFIYVI